VKRLKTGCGVVQGIGKINLGARTLLLENLFLIYELELVVPRGNLRAGARSSQGGSQGGPQGLSSPGGGVLRNFLT
jgi:hypothetical protein